MKMMNLKSGSRIEPLESRIAPAVLVNGANLLGGGHSDSGYTSIGGNAVTLVKVSAGEALVWFDASTQEITGISVANGTKLDITGNVYGDIVANLTSSGHLTDSDNNAANGYDGDVLLANNILGITTHALSGENGDIGRIITGGSISHLSINGQISGIYAGDGVYRSASLATTGSGSSLAVDVTVGLDVNIVQGGIQSGYSFLKSDAIFTSGASIQSVDVQTGDELQIMAGDGTKAGGSGGSVSGVTIHSAFTGDSAIPSYAIYAGDGADGTKGGSGGSISSVTETNASGIVAIVAGNGGDGTAGAGGAGGTVTKMNGQSDSATYEITGGTGGDGAKGGGAGGSLKNNNFASQTPGTDIMVTGDFVNASGGLGTDGLQDLIIVDTSTGQMVLEENTGSGYTAVSQGSSSLINAVGATPDSAVAVDLNGDGYLDLVVSYKNSNNIGVFMNNGHGVFSSSSLSLSSSPLEVAAGNFSGDSHMDIAVIASTAAGSGAYIFQGNGTTTFTLLPTVTALGTATVTALQTIAYSNNTYGLAVGFDNGDVQVLLPTGVNSTPFSIVDDGTLATGSITNFDVDAGTSQLLVFSAGAASLSTYGYSSNGSLILLSTVDTTGLTGTLLKAQFVNTGNTYPSIGLLSSGVATSQLDIFTTDGTTWTDSTTLESSKVLKDFVAIGTSGDSDIAALGGSLSKFYYSESLGAFQTGSLPFTGKSVNATAGNGGSSTGTGAGGAGGSIVNINAEADLDILVAGAGGTGTTGSGGVGGSISNAGSFLVGAQSFTATVIGTDAVTAVAGHGGSSANAAGGAGGAVSGLKITVTQGDAVILSGSGGTGGGGNGGAGGNVKSLQVSSSFGNVEVVLGSGGGATGATGNGGNGGSLVGLTQTLSVPDDLESVEQSFNITLVGGGGGSSVNGLGGNGGSLSKLVLNEDPTNSATTADSTVYVTLVGGSGGAGTSGGAGGSVSNIKETTTLDEVDDTGAVVINHVAMSVHAGTGGTGSTAKGGAGGSVSGINAVGLTSYDPASSDSADPALLVMAGTGGSGATIGGAGGSITSVVSSNTTGPNNANIAYTELDAAELMAGSGGSGGTKGGAGGSVSSFSIGVQSSTFSSSAPDEGGSLTVISGNGGDSANGIGGAGGSVTSGEVAAVGGDANATVDTGILTKYDGSQITGYSILVATGSGGDGATAGGAGGGISTIQISTPQSDVNDSTYGTLFVAGGGGDASASGGKGGVGGSISGVKQAQDVNSAISVLQAGNGGDAVSGTGGNGGSVSGIHTVGFIGKPSNSSGQLGAFDNGLAQGVFSGNGGAGATAGLAGSVSSISAQQIAAIAAAVTPGGTFGLAAKVSNITSDVIGYDINGNTTFDDGNGGAVSPSTSVSTGMDGFILASTIAGISTADNSRTANFEFTS